MGMSINQRSSDSAETISFFSLILIDRIMSKVALFIHCLFRSNNSFDSVHHIVTHCSENFSAKDFSGSFLVGRCVFFILLQLRLLLSALHSLCSICPQRGLN